MLLIFIQLLFMNKKILLSLLVIRASFSYLKLKIVKSETFLTWMIEDFTGMYKTKHILFYW